MSNETIVRWTALLVVMFLAFVALKLAESVFAPLLLALVLGIVLSPVTDTLERTGLPKALGALLTLGVGLLLLGGLIVLLEPVVRSAVAKAPNLLTELRTMLTDITWFLQGIEKASSEVAEAITPAPDAGTAVANAAKPVQGEADAGAAVALPTVGDALLYAPALAAQVLIFVGSLFFFVLSRNEIYDWMARRAAPGHDRAEVAASLRRAERRVSRYFLTITMINAGFGTIVAIAFKAIGLPAPILWGLTAFALNYILYLGPVIVATMLVLAGLLAFNGAAVFLPAAIYGTLNMIEGQFVTPALVSRQIRVNPLLVFLSLVFWLWLWGPIGGFIALPLLIWGLAVAAGMPERPRHDGSAIAADGSPAVPTGIGNTPTPDRPMRTPV